MIVPVSNIEQYGRAWELTVITEPDAAGAAEVLVISSSSWEPEALRITFDVSQPAYAAYWFADVTIYNLNSPTEQKLIRQGFEVILKAGYQAGPLGEIFRGRVFQPLWDREDVTDGRLMLHCIVARESIAQNFVSLSGRYSKQTDIIAKMAEAAHTPIEIENLQAADFKPKNISRPTVLFGSPQRYLEDMAIDNGLMWWVSGNGLNMGNLRAPGPNEAIEFGPGRGLVGTPQVTQDGVQFRVFLEPRLQISLPPQQVKLDMAVIRQLARYPGNYYSILDQDGIYIVGGLRHHGDSRGNAWYTDVTGYTGVDGKLALLGTTGNLTPRG